MVAYPSTFAATTGVFKMPLTQSSPPKVNDFPTTYEGGNKALFRGGFTTVLRAVAMNASMTGPYDYLREKLWITFGDFGFIDVIPLFYAAAWGTAFTLPIDNIKTRM